MFPPPKPSTKPTPRAKTGIRHGQKRPKAGTGAPISGAEAPRLLHELQVHQVELEVQNVELQEARNRMEVLLEKYTDLYDFAPIGYFSLNEQGRVMEVNLTGAALLGLDRSQLLDRRLTQFVPALSQPTFQAFLERVFGGTEKQVCEISLQTADGTAFWANLHGAAALSPKEARQWCRVSVSDISSLKQAEEAQRRLETLALANRELRAEIIRRQAVELSLKRSEQRQRQLLEESRQLQEEARSLSRRLLHVQEKERKRISRELHDEIAQTLVGIHVHLENLTREVTTNPAAFKRKITQTQRLVEKSVDSVQRFARELRPASLDDLGLIASLHSHLKSFAQQTGIRVHFTAFSGVEQLTNTRRTALYRVAHSALTNVAQHARASQVTVSLRKASKTVCMEISDDGQAFDAKRISRAKRNVHLGLLGMRERIEMVGGKLTVESKPGHGTTIRVQIPFRKKLPLRAKGGGGNWSFMSESCSFMKPDSAAQHISVLLADDHTIVREGLRRLLEGEGDIEVIGEAANGREAVELARTLRPSVVVMDIAMPVLNGLEAARQIRKADPDMKVLILSAHSDDAYLEQAVGLAAAGYLIKQSSARELCQAVRAIYQGNTSFSPMIAQRVRRNYGRLPKGSPATARPENRLSSREVEVLQLIAEGHPNKGIAADLGISVKTVEKHRQRIMDKLAVHDTAGLTRYAIAAGLVESSVQFTIH